MKNKQLFLSIIVLLTVTYQLQSKEQTFVSMACQKGISGITYDPQDIFLIAIIATGSFIIYKYYCASKNKVVYIKKEMPLLS